MQTYSSSSSRVYAILKPNQGHYFHDAKAEIKNTLKSVNILGKERGLNFIKNLPGAYKRTLLSSLTWEIIVDVYFSPLKG